MPTPRVRFAPSPTGPLHIGGLRTALYNYLLAKQRGGTFLLRIEDTDRSRYVEGAEAYIREALEWCGLVPDEGPGSGGAYGPYRQSERGDLYRGYVRQLVDRDLAYYAFDTPEALAEARASAEAGGTVFRYDAMTRDRFDNSLHLDRATLEKRLTSGEPRVVRLAVAPDDEVSFRDEIRGTVRFSTDELDDKVLLKADGLPTYHLANVVDDREMAITHVIRGEEWLPSTAHHVLLYRAFGWGSELPSFAHLPLILKPQGKGKLSKRDGAKFGVPVFPLEWHDEASGEVYAGFREAGYLPEAVVNFLALLGWNPGGERELFDRDALVEAFDLDKVGKSGARFDIDKANWFNQQYIQHLTDEAFVTVVRPTLAAAHVSATDDYLLRVAPLVRERLTHVTALPVDHRYLFESPGDYDEAQSRKRLAKADLDALAPLAGVLEAVDPWTATAAAAAVKGWAQERGVKLGALLPLYRIALTGGMSGPDVFELGELIGKRQTVDRWSAALRYFRTLGS